MATTAKLKEKSRLREEVEKAKADLVTELTTFCGQVDKAKANVIAEFRVSPSLTLAVSTTVMDSTTT